MLQTDAGLEVHQRLGPYIPASTLTSRMRLSTRAVNLLYIIRDYSPITTVLAMLLLPLVLIPIGSADDIFNTISAKHEAYLIWSWRVFLAAHLARTFHGYITYQHVGPVHVANIHSQELWSAPCKHSPYSSPILHLCYAAAIPNIRSPLRRSQLCRSLLLAFRTVNSFIMTQQC